MCSAKLGWGLWWAEDMVEFSVNRKTNWRWTMTIAQPEAVTPSLFETIRQEVRHKKALPALGLIRLETFAEGRAGPGPPPGQLCQ